MMSGAAGGEWPNARKDAQSTAMSKPQAGIAASHERSFPRAMLRIPLTAGAGGRRA